MPKPRKEPELDFGKLDEKLLNYCIGKLCLAIGAGTLRNELSLIINNIMSAAFRNGYEHAERDAAAKQAEIDAGEDL